MRTLLLFFTLAGWLHAADVVLGGRVSFGGRVGVKSTSASTNSPPAAPQVTVADLWTHFEAGTVGQVVTVEDLAAATHGLAGTWSLSTNIPTQLVISTNETSLRNPLVVAGVTNTDAGSTRGLRTGTSTAADFARFDPALTRTNVTLTVFIRFGPDGSTFSTFDYLSIDLQAGDFCVCNLDDKPGAQYGVRAHTKAGGGSKITIVPGQVYELELQATQGGQCLLTVRSATTGTQIGATSSLALEDSPIRAIRIGRVDAHGSAPAAATTYDDLVLRL